MKWYAVKKKSEKRWTAYKWEEEREPEVKRGYEILGPFDDLISCWMAANKFHTPTGKKKKK